MLILKECSVVKRETDRLLPADMLDVVYTVRHNTAEYSTALEQDLYLRINSRTGEVEGKLVIGELSVGSMPEALEKMATWCERMALALRTPMKAVASVPVFEKDWDAINAAEAAQLGDGAGDNDKT